MPTGYTAKLCNEDQSFTEFALTCARAFGACIMQRDDMYEPPKLREKDTYLVDALAQAKKALAKMKKMSAERREAFGRRTINEDIQRCNEQIEEHRVTANRIKKMIAEVERWQPPSSDHTSLKSFMLEQLRTTLDHDGDASYYEKEKSRLLAMEPIDMYNDHLKRAEWNVQYHAERLVKEEVRVDDANDWIIQLYDSLGIEIK